MRNEPKTYKIQISELQNIMGDAGLVSKATIETADIGVIIDMQNENPCLFADTNDPDADLHMIRCPSPYHAIALFAMYAAAKWERGTAQEGQSDA